MLSSHPVQRRAMMFAMFARHYGELALGIRYPHSVDTINSYLTPYEKQTLYRAARLLGQGAQLAEIGSFQGGSSCCLAAGVADKNATLHCIDTFMAENMNAEQQRDTYQQFLANTNAYTHIIQVHRGYSYDVVGDFTQPLDLLFVDGDHSWEGVTTDLKLYVPLMKPNGILVMHDTAYPPVRKALETVVLPAETERIAVLPNMYAGRINPALIRLDRAG